MSARALQSARLALRTGVGQTSLTQRVLPPEQDVMPIPGRAGAAPSALARAESWPPMARGFVVSAFGAAAGDRFDPYSLASLTYPYSLVHAPYSVQAFETGYNVADGLLWHDVISFFANRIWVNAMRMPALEIPAAVLPGRAIPYLIPHSQNLPYGDSVINQTQKRIFAVGRSAVKAFSAGVPQVQLAPESARSEGRAVTAGPRTIGAAHQAIMAQIYYAGLAFDAPGAAWMASWTTVQMALIAPILTAVNGSAALDQPLCPLNAGSSVPVSETAAVSLPPVELCAVGVAEGGATSFTPEGLYEMSQWAIWPCRQVKTFAVPASKAKSGSRQTWSGSASASPAIAGATLTYAATNSITIDSLTESYSFAAFDAPLFASTGGGTALGYAGEYFASGGGYAVWQPPTGDLRDRSANGGGEYHHMGGAIPGSAAYQRSTQAGTFSVRSGMLDLVRIEYSRTRETGQTVTPTPISGRFSGLLADPYLWLSQATGSYEQNASCLVRMWSWDPYNGNVIGKRQIEIGNKISWISGGKFYDNVNAYNSAPLYTGPVSTRPLIDERALSWITRDYLLLDEENGVSIVIKGQFVGAQSGAAQGSATLTVSLVVTTRYHEWSLQLMSSAYTYAELLPEQPLPNSGGKTAVPSPQLRAFFAPMFREQGSFPGASYITAAEETAGATPAHLFNFRLRLRRYQDIASIDADNASGPAIHCLPANLLEALYATVFSGDFGVGAQRYPVTNSARYQAVVASLFTPTWDIRLRNGVAEPWPETVRPQLSATADLTRT